MTIVQATMFDYAELDTETRIVVQQRTSEIKALMKRAASEIIDIGQKLIEVKARLEDTLGYGHFGKWLNAEFDWSADTAGRFMGVAKQFGSFPQIAESFAPSALYLLAAPSTPDEARAEAIARAEEGETITHATARGIVHDHKYSADPYAEPQTVPFVPTNADYADFYGDEEPDLWETSPGVAVIQPPADARYAPISDRTDYDGDEWKTPIEWIEAARNLMGAIDLDPATNPQSQDLIQAGTAYTKNDNGLDRPWCMPDGTAARVWCNPPYSTALIQAFANKALDEYRAGNVSEALVLVNNCTDTGWFFSLAQQFPIMFSRGRVGFWYEDPNDKTPTRQGQALFYFGPNVNRFYECFAHVAYAPIGRQA